MNRPLLYVTIVTDTRSVWLMTNELEHQQLLAPRHPTVPQRLAKCTNSCKAAKNQRSSQLDHPNTANDPFQGFSPKRRENRPENGSRRNGRAYRKRSRPSEVLEGILQKATTPV